MSDLLAAADRACSSYWLGSDKSKINLREAMTELRAQVDRAKKELAARETNRIERK